MHMQPDDYTMTTTLDKDDNAKPMNAAQTGGNEDQVLFYRADGCYSVSAEFLKDNSA